MLNAPSSAMPSAATGVKQTTPASLTKPRSIAIPPTGTAPFMDLTPPSSPSEDEVAGSLNDSSSKASEAAAPPPSSSTKAAAFGAPSGFKHYVSRSSFFTLNGNNAMNALSSAEEDSRPNSPPLSPPTLPTSSTVEIPEDGEEEEKKPMATLAPTAPVVSTIPAFRHASTPASFSANININGRRPSPKQQPETTSKPAASSSVENAASQHHDPYLPPSPALTPSNSSSASSSAPSTVAVASAMLDAIEDLDKPPTKFSHRCRFCAQWIEARYGPGRGKATRAVRLHMIQWHAAQLSIGVYRDDVGKRDVGVGWIC